MKVDRVEKSPEEGRWERASLTTKNGQWPRAVKADKYGLDKRMEAVRGLEKSFAGSIRTPAFPWGTDHREKVEACQWVGEPKRKKNGMSQTAMGEGKECSFAGSRGRGNQTIDRRTTNPRIASAFARIKFKRKNTTQAVKRIGRPPSPKT